MARLPAALFLFLIVLKSVHAKRAVVFCDDTYGMYTSIAGNLMLATTEFPIMSTVPPGSSGISDLAIPKQMHPCYSLSVNNNYKNQLYDIFDYGNFGPTVCERQCAHYVSAFRLTCGDRRPPPTWIVGSLGSTIRKINCSDWAIPLTDKGRKDGIQFTFTYGTFDTATGVISDPPYVMDNKSMKYLDDMFIKGFHIKPMVNPGKKATAMDEMEYMLDLFVQKHPEIIHVAFGNPVVTIGDSVKYSAPRFEPSDKFYATLAKLPSLMSLSLSLMNITGKETIPSGMTKNLKSIGFYNVTMKDVPSWVQSDQLEFIEFQVSLNDNTGVAVLDKLPGLEHFLLTESPLTAIKSPFLAQSTKLLSLTLQCNAISSIAESAFDHLTELKFLNLAGNRIVSLPDNLFANLDNLLTLDLKIIDSTKPVTLQTFNEVLMQCQIGQNYSESHAFETMPKVPKPEVMMALDIRGQSNFLKNDNKLLKDFKNLEILSLGNLGLSSIQNLSLETMCNLIDLNVIGNPLDDHDWIGDDIFVNVNLQRLRLGTPKNVTNVPNSLVAFMRTSSQIMYSVPTSLNLVDVFRYKIGCSYDTMFTATMFSYEIQNASCSSHVKTAIDDIRSMEMLKMDTQCA